MSEMNSRLYTASSVTKGLYAAAREAAGITMVAPSLPNACLAALLLCLLACTPVQAHNATEMGVAPDQYDLGIPVYWPYHAAFMTTGIVLFLGGFAVMRFRLTGN